MNLNRRGGTMSLSGKWGIDPKRMGDRVDSQYLLSDNLEYIDAAAATAGGWTDTGSPTWAYTTAPAPLEGLRSLLLSSSAVASVKSFSPASDVWAYCLVNVDSITNSPYVLRLRDGSGTQVAAIRFMNTGAIRVYTDATGNNTSASTSLCAANTTYHLWLRYVKGTGANSAAYAYISSTGIKPGSADVSKTNGAATTDASQFYARLEVSTTNGVIDKARVSVAEIGSNPN